MQDRKDGPDNVIWLSERRGAHRRPGTGAATQAPRAGSDPAVARFARARRAWRPEVQRLLTALDRLDGAVSELGGAVAELEGGMHRLHSRLGSAVTRLEAQKRQNAQVLQCLDSGDVAAMEACRNRIRDGQPF